MNLEKNKKNKQKQINNVCQLSFSSLIRDSLHKNTYFIIYQLKLSWEIFVKK